MQLPITVFDQIRDEPTRSHANTYSPHPQWWSGSLSKVVIWLRIYLLVQSGLVPLGTLHHVAKVEGPPYRLDAECFIIPFDIPV